MCSGIVENIHKIHRNADAEPIEQTQGSSCKREAVKLEAVSRTFSSWITIFTVSDVYLRVLASHQHSDPRHSKRK